MHSWYRVHGDVFEDLLCRLIADGGRRTYNPLHDSTTIDHMQQMLLLGLVSRPDSLSGSTFEITARGRRMAAVGPVLA